MHLNSSVHPLINTSFKQKVLTNNGNRKNIQQSLLLKNSCYVRDTLVDTIVEIMKNESLFQGSVLLMEEKNRCKHK
jgi:hypothetical protein